MLWSSSSRFVAHGPGVSGISRGAAQNGSTGLVHVGTEGAFYFGRTVQSLTTLQSLVT